MDALGTLQSLKVGGSTYGFFSLAALQRGGRWSIERLPFCMRILAENLLRSGNREDLESLLSPARHNREIPFKPARILLQDFTGVPVLVDLATMRDAAESCGADPDLVNPVIPVDLVIDHSAQVDFHGTKDAFSRNLALEYRRNAERYSFMQWGGQSFRNLRVIPPATGIVHQVNLEHLATVVRTEETAGGILAFPDTVLGTDSHTTMINGLGVLGWGVGGIEAEAAMLGYPVSMLVPEVIGFRLEGRIQDGVTVTDAVLAITETLRLKGVVGKFVEFFGPGSADIGVPDRATIANMAPEYGATIGFFPPDETTLKYLSLTGRGTAHVALAEAYLKEQGILRTPDSPEPDYSETISLDLSTIEPCVSGPRRPHDRVSIRQLRESFMTSLTRNRSENGLGIEPQEAAKSVRVVSAGAEGELHHGSVVIASITSCTNTANPEVMITAGLLAKRAVEKGLAPAALVKTSFSPGSKVVVAYLDEAGLSPFLDKLGFNLTGFGCMTCIGNSGPLPAELAGAIEDGGIVATAVLSGNRNFEGRIHPLARAAYLASPPLVIAYAIAGKVDINLISEPLGRDNMGNPVFLRDIWPKKAEVLEIIARVLRPGVFGAAYSGAFLGDENWRRLPALKAPLFNWAPDSTYIKAAPYFEGFTLSPKPLQAIEGARALILLQDFVTTDHISPAGTIPAASPAGSYLKSRGVEAADFNSYGARRGNHEVMLRGTFANIRLKNILVPGTEGGITVHLPDSRQMTVYEAAQEYAKARTPLVIIAGKEYGTGSSRDWAAKGTRLLGVRAVIARSFERIHRANLAGMGVLPLEFMPGESADALGITGREIFDVLDLENLSPRKVLRVRSRNAGKDGIEFKVTARLDTGNEVECYLAGGILPAVLRRICLKTAAKGHS